MLSCINHDENNKNYTMVISKIPFYKSINNNIFIYENVLSKSLLEECEEFVHKCINNNNYTTTNHIDWPDYVVNQSDVINIIKLEIENIILKEKICNELRNNLNFITEGLYLNIHIMQKNCYISEHTDNNNNFAFTIYLNKIWKKENGGIFQFDIDDTIYNVLPKYNSMVLLKDNIHRVTKITSNELRITIQGFYLEKFFYKNNSIDYLIHNNNEGKIMF